MFFRQNGLRGRADGRRNDDFDKLAFDDFSGGLFVQFAVKRDNAAECRGRVGGIGLVVSGKQAVGLGYAAGVGMLDDDAGGLVVEGFDAFQRGIGIGNVVVGQFLALQLLGGGNRAGGRCFFPVKRRVLMRVFAVTHGLVTVKLQIQGFGKLDAVRCCPDRPNRGVVTRGVFKAFQRQIEAGLLQKGCCLFFSSAIIDA